MSTEEKKVASVEYDHKEAFLGMDLHTMMSSIDLDKKFKTLFEDTFADFVGFRPAWNMNNGRFTLSAFFVQKEFKDGVKTAFTMQKQDKSAALTARIKRMQNIASNASFFELSEDAKNAFKDYMAIEAKDVSGKNIRWDNNDVVCQLGDPVQGQIGMSKTYNVIHYIDPLPLLRTLYGEKADMVDGYDDDGNPLVREVDVDYDIAVLGIQTNINAMNGVQEPNVMATGITNKPVVLDIHQVNSKGMQAISKSLGIQYRNALGIDE